MVCPHCTKKVAFRRYDKRTLRKKRNIEVVKFYCDRIVQMAMFAYLVYWVWWLSCYSDLRSLHVEVISGIFLALFVSFCLVLFKDIEHAQLRALDCVKGTTHQGSTRFSPLSRGNQCTPISYFAVLYSSVVDVDRWSVTRYSWFCANLPCSTRHNSAVQIRIVWLYCMHVFMRL